MTEAALCVLESGRELRFGYRDLTRYHGFGFPGGVAHAFQVMARAFLALDGGNPPERREISIRTAFQGPGARDGFELVTRAATEGRYAVAPELERPERGATLMRYVFVLRYRSRSVTLTIRDGHVRDEFIALSRKPLRTPAEEARLTWLKTDMADGLIALPAAQVYDLVE